LDSRVLFLHQIFGANTRKVRASQGKMLDNVQWRRL